MKESSLHCPLYRFDEPIGEVTDEMKEEVLSTFIDVTNLALGRNKKGER